MSGPIRAPALKRTCLMSYASGLHGYQSTRGKQLFGNFLSIGLVIVKSLVAILRFDHTCLFSIHVLQQLCTNFFYIGIRHSDVLYRFSLEMSIDSIGMPIAI